MLICKLEEQGKTRNIKLSICKMRFGEKTAEEISVIITDLLRHHQEVQNNPCLY